VDDAARRNISQRLDELIAAATTLADRGREASRTLDEGNPYRAYQVMYQALDLRSQITAVRESFDSAGISPSP
jgi:hypothetical protein